MKVFEMALHQETYDTIAMIDSTITRPEINMICCIGSPLLNCDLYANTILCDYCGKLLDVQPLYRTDF